MSEQAELAIRETAEVATTGRNTPADLVRIAVESGADVEKLEKLMDLQERWEAKEARRAFFAAMSQFQASAPELEKNASVDYKAGGGRTSYRFAALPHIVGQIREPLQECGLSYRFEIRRNEGGLTVACIVTHTGGHSERTEMNAPPDTTGSKNAIQASGSTVTYLQRYTLLAALGLVTGDQDDDGATAGAPAETVNEGELKTLREQTATLKCEPQLLKWARDTTGLPVRSLEEFPRVLMAGALDVLAQKLAKLEGNA